MDKTDLKKRTKQFAIDCIMFCEGLPNTFIGNHIRGQLIRCCSSVAANYRASCLDNQERLIVLNSALL